MRQFVKLASPALDRRLLLGTLGLLGIGLVAGPGGTARAQTKPKPPPKGKIVPPPADVNDLNLEVAALRTLYLLQAGPEQQGERTTIPGHELGQYGPMKRPAKECAQKARTRQKADVSKNYLKVLTELRAAFIAGYEDRITELSEQLDELGQSEQPDFDDAVEITDQARKEAPRLLRFFNPAKLAGYLAAYGKDFPDSWLLMYQTMRLDGKGKKPTAEEWKNLRAFVIQEVSWQIAGLGLNQQKKIGEQAAKLLDQAYAMSDEELKKNGRPGGGLRGALAQLVNQVSPTDPLKHVLEQDLAELLSNPRLLPAIEAREQYLKK